MADKNLADIMKAIELNRVDELDRLLKGRGRESMNKVLSHKYPPLGYAVKLQHFDCVTCLLKNGADINQSWFCAETGSGTTVLMWVIWEKDVPCARRLLELGADPERTGGFYADSWPLSIAVLSGCAEMVQLLLDFNANVNSRAPADRTTALMEAADFARLDMVKLLLENDCDFELECIDGETALMKAFKGCNWNVVKALLSAGADIDRIGQDGRYRLNALAAAMVSEGDFLEMDDPKYQVELQEVLKIVMSSDENANLALLHAVCEDHRSETKVLVSFGAFPVVYKARQIENTSYGYSIPMSLLQFAWTQHHYSIVRFLMQSWFFTAGDIKFVGRKKEKKLRGLKKLSTTRPNADLNAVLTLPWSLQVLSFVKISSMLDRSSLKKRQEQIKKLEIPAVLKKKLLFQSGN